MKNFRELTLKDKILAAIGLALSVVIVVFVIYTVVVVVDGLTPDTVAEETDDTVYEVNFDGEVTINEVDYEVALRGSDGTFTVSANKITGVTDGTYTFTEGQGWTFSFDDSSSTVVRTQYDEDAKVHSFIYHLDLGSRGEGNLVLSCADDSFSVDGEAWADIPSFSGTAGFFYGAVSTDCYCACDADGNFTIYSDSSAAAQITSITGTYEYTDGAYVFTSEDGDVYTTSVNDEGLHEFTVSAYCPSLATYGDSIAYTDLVLTQVVLTVD